MMSLPPAGLRALTARIQQEVDNGHVTAAQVAIARDSEVLAFQSFGAAVDSTRFTIYSATKALVAMALLPHFADGTLDLTTPVAHYISEFGHHGKSEVTVLQLLTMQGGFPQAPMPPRGAGGQLCWVDPDSGISFCFLTDTLHQDPRVEFRRAADLNGLVLDLLQQ